MRNLTLTLYHGSKSGICGAITPSSRQQCDFGRGFYMGTHESQPLTLICSHENPKIYTIEFDMTDLNVLELKPDIDWALLIAYYRGAMDMARGTAIYNQFSEIANAEYDVIAGMIANDKMYSVLERFLSKDSIGAITDYQLVQCLSALQLGTQYVAKTQKACERVKIINERTIDADEKDQLIGLSESMRKQGISLAADIVRQNRRTGRYFDEILGR